MKKKEKNKKLKIPKIAIVILLLLAVIAIVMIAPNYLRDDLKDRTNLVINNRNVTANLKNPVYVDENGNVYLSTKDITNYFDKYLYYDEANNQYISTYEKKTATISKTEPKKIINGAEKAMTVGTIERDGQTYLPFSELKDLYNMDLNYVAQTDTVIVGSLEKELVKVDASKKLSIKYKAKDLSRTMAKVEKGEKLIWVSDVKGGWSKVRTTDGIIGFVKTKHLANKTYVRNELKEEKQIEGRVNLTWDYFSKYGKAPNRNGTTIDGVNVVSPTFFSVVKNGNGKINENVGESGKTYINWAKSKGYKVWAVVSNTEETEMMETTSHILTDYPARQRLIENIVNMVIKYDLDGINIDFENIKQDDKDMFSRFIIELAPRLKELGKVLSVDVTAPDGAPNWSLCFDRHVIGDVADYIIFMAYDQHGASSNKAGTTAGYNWVETNLKKFIETEEIDKDKIILGIPFYTRLWKEKPDGTVSSSVANMKDIEYKLGDKLNSKVWKDDVRQNYIEYTEGSNHYKMWIEDIDSLKEKLSLIKQYEIGGVASWSKDREPENIWPIIKEAL